MNSNEIVPNGTKVRYHGSLDYMHGEYTVVGPYDLTLRSDLTPEKRAEHYPDGVAYELWPVGVPIKFGNRDQALYSVRRQSFTVID